MLFKSPVLYSLCLPSDKAASDWSQYPPSANRKTPLSRTFTDSARQSVSQDKMAQLNLEIVVFNESLKN